MPKYHYVTLADQVADELRKGFHEGRWIGHLPGRDRLADELHVSTKTIEAAIRQLQEEGRVSSEGAGKRRKIIPTDETPEVRPLRIAILDEEPLDIIEGYDVAMQHLLQEAGHTAFFTRKCLLDLDKEVRRLARLVGEYEADAWIVKCPSRAVLEWFVGEGIPVFAQFGRRRGMPVAAAGPDKVSAYREVVRKLVGLGHRRISLVALADRRHPEPGASERAFLDELAQQGLPTGSFNLPDWQESRAGIDHLVKSLFRMTPPTALLIDEAYLFHAVKHSLAQREIIAPRDISLICTDPDRTFEWCSPSIAHIYWDPRPINRRIVRWANNIARGKEDFRQTVTKAKFVEGGTIGPAP